ncbi:MAG TPA: cytochrome c maturation protein CcmE [Acidimicrobiales bacterium]|nr:cytochrome c maturation protein CcmE [Acidimicrobiales bacterium]
MTDRPTPVDPHAPFEDDHDVDGLDLTPRQAPPVGGGRTDRGTRFVVLGVLGVLVVALVFMAYQGLNSATVFFRNVDEAVAERDELGDKRFRLQGSVVDGSMEAEGGVVTFAVEYGGERAEVHHIGDPPELFQPDIPVVLEGRWSQEGDWFDSDRILVKHEEEYEAENPERTDDFVGEGSSQE